MAVNAVGREIPEEIDGRRLRPFRGAFATPLEKGKRMHAPEKPMVPPGQKKLLSSLDEVFERIELEDGATLSFHHHLRDGDFVVNMVMGKIEKMGLKNIRMAHTALFPTHEPLVKLIEKGVITHTEGSVNGPVGRAISMGKMKGIATLRSHGGRVRAIQDGDIEIDAAFIAAPTADDYGNCNGLYGPSAFGPMSYPKIDAKHAKYSVVLTDNLVPYPNVPIAIPQHQIDYVVPVDRIGDPEKIMTGTMRITSSPTRLKIARYAAQIVKETGTLRNGFSFQAGAGGISLAATKFLGEMMKKEDIHASFANGGTTKPLIDILNAGLIDVLVDGQTFDLVGIDSLRNNPKHVEIGADFYANIHNKGCNVNTLDVAFLGATEIDTDFNVNVNTHSDGVLLHGIGGHQDVASGTKMSMMLVPSRRGRVPIIVDRVQTVTTPGEVVDVVVTEKGIAINPGRDDLLESLHGSSLPIMTIEELKKIIQRETGRPKEPEFGDRIVGLIEYRDGTILDVIRQMKV